MKLCWSTLADNNKQNDQKPCKNPSGLEEEEEEFFEGTLLLTGQNAASTRRGVDN
jgi:hypothetical protein